MRKTVTVRSTQVTLSGKTPMELAMGRRPRDLLDPASLNPEQLTPRPTKQDLLNEEIQKLAMRTHLEIQQREDIRRDHAERLKCVPPVLQAGENVFYWQKYASKIQQGRESGKWLNVEIIAVKSSVALISSGATVFQASVSKLRRLLDTVDLVELPDSRERTRAPVLWLSCERRIDVWEMFSDNSYLSAILDRQGHLVAAPIDFRTKKAESFFATVVAGLLVQAQEEESQDRCDVPDCYHEEP